GGGVAQAGAEAARLVHGGVDARVDMRGDLDGRLEQLGLDPLVRAGRLGDLVEARDELVALGREEHELLLDAEAERLAPAEVQLHRAARYPVGGDPARGRRADCSRRNRWSAVWSGRGADRSERGRGSRFP